MRRAILLSLLLANCRFTSTPSHPGTVFVDIPFVATVEMGKSSPGDTATAWGCVGHPAGWTATATVDGRSDLYIIDPTRVVNKPAIDRTYAWSCWDLSGLYTTVTAWIELTPSAPGEATLTYFVESQANTGSDIAVTTVSVLPSDEDGDGALSIAAGGEDCDDTRADVAPGAPEVCDGVDGDCNGLVDDVAVLPLWYLDADADGYGSETTSRAQCDAPGPEWTSAAGDCDDADVTVGPDAVEGCDAVDNNCNGSVDELTPDADADGICDDLDLRLSTTALIPGQLATFVIENAPPGAQAAVLLSRAAGGPDLCLPGFTFPSGDPACVDLVRPLILPASPVGPEGISTWTVRVPSTFPPGLRLFALGAVWSGGVADTTGVVPLTVD
jgi:hypothetical protein